MEHLGYLPEIVILLVAAVLIVAIFKRLNLSPVLGYLVAGAAIGEYGLGYVDSSHFFVLAEFGVVFLLFAIGLELTIERLMGMRWHVFGFGGAQVLLTSIAGALIAQYFGVSVEASIVIGGSLALSSTAVVLRVIADNNSSATQVGRLSIATLILQDFAVVPLLVLVPLLADNQNEIASVLGSVMIKATIALIIIFFVGRMLLRPMFNLIASANSNELFVAATLLVVLGTSFATKYLGLSLAMGAFIAGLLVAETQYQHKVEENIMPFKDLLMGLFFMTVGMSINLNAIYLNMLSIIGLSLALIVIKSGIIIGLCRLFKFPWGSSIRSGFLLAQGSEFAFILFGLASQGSIGLIDQETTQTLLLVVTVTMALTPVMTTFGQWLSEKVCSHADEDIKDSDEATEDLNRHVIIAGYGRVGEMVAKLLAFKRINFVILESDAKSAKKAKAAGLPVFRGDPTKLDALKKVGIDRAKAVIITVRDNIYLKKSIRTINKNYPEISIVVRAEDMRNAKTLEKIGANIIIPEKYESGLQLAGALLGAIGVSDWEISQIKNMFRADNYELAKDMIHVSPETNK